MGEACGWGKESWEGEKERCRQRRKNGRKKNERKSMPWAKEKNLKFGRENASRVGGEWRRKFGNWGRNRKRKRRREPHLAVVWHRHEQTGGRTLKPEKRYVRHEGRRWRAKKTSAKIRKGATQRWRRNQNAVKENWSRREQVEKKR